jgi:hypothetical protein
VIRYLTIDEVLQLHQLIIQRFGGPAGVRDQGGLESAIAGVGILLGAIPSGQLKREELTAWIAGQLRRRTS